VPPFKRSNPGFPLRLWLPRQLLHALLYLLRLTAMEGGNAVGLSGTILAMQSSAGMAFFFL